MNSTEKSQSINPLRLAEAGELIEGSLKLDSFKRLHNVSFNKHTGLDYRLSFYIDESGTYVIDSEISTNLILECQRCLANMNVEIHKSSLLGIMSSQDKLQSLDEKYEPLQLDDDELQLEELLEDELLLAIPFSPTHAEDECPAKPDFDRIKAEASLKPFAALAALKKNTKAK